MFPPDPPPVIILGMHRSGTSLLARVLHDAGIFMGWRRNVHDESLFFLNQNEKLFRLAHAAWDQPAPALALPQNDSLRPQVVAELRHVVRSWRAWSFTGGRRLTGAWGWKDPRTLFTLPLWLEVFPEARVVRVCRHPLDVALSLQKREQNRRDPLHNPLLSLRCLDLNGALSLWLEYETRSQQLAQTLPPDRQFALRYEDFLHEPAAHLDRLRQFLRHPFPPAAVARAIAAADPTRAFAHRRQSPPPAFDAAIGNHPTLKASGYQLP